MIKIWFMLVLISIPNSPSVKYNGFLYPDEAECQMAKYELLELYDARPDDYKAGLAMDAYCVEFESFPIRGLSKTGTGI